MPPSEVPEVPGDIYRRVLNDARDSAVTLSARIKWYRQNSRPVLTASELCDLADAEAALYRIERRLSDEDRH